MIFIFDREENFQAKLSNEDKEACPYWGAEVKEVLGAEFTFSFVIPHDHRDAYLVQELGYVAIKDYERNYQLFVITEIEEIHGAELVKRVFCEHASIEMNDEFIDDAFIPTSGSSLALDDILAFSRWQAGNVTPTDEHQYTIKRKSVRQALSTFSKRWNLELKFRVEISGNAITARYVDAVERRGYDTGKRFEYRKDIQEVSRTILANEVKTALYGFGKETEDENGNKQRVDFSSVQWSTEPITTNILTENQSSVETSLDGLTAFASGKVIEFVRDTSAWVFGGASARATLQDTPNAYMDIRTSPTLTQIDETQTYTASVYSKVNQRGGHECVLNVYFYDANQTYLSAQGTYRILVGTEWQRLELTFTPPTGATQCYLALRMMDAETNMILWWDGAQLEQNDSATSFILGGTTRTWGGKPLDKPLGQTWIGDENARELYGMPSNGSKLHREGFTIQSSIETPEELLLSTYEALLNTREPIIQYDVKVIDLMKILGLDQEQIHIGDIVNIIDADLNLRVRARVIEYNFDKTLPEQSTIVLGNFLPRVTSQIDEFQTIVDEAVANQPYPNDMLREGDEIQTNWLTGVIEAQRNQVYAGSGTVQMTDGEGILIVDDPENPQKAIKLIAGTIAFANERDPVTGLFNWRAFGTADGWISDLVQTGKISFNNATGGTLELGGVSNQNGVLIINNSIGEEIARLSGDYGGFGSLRIDELQATNNVVFTTNSNSQNTDGYAIYYYVDPNDGDDSAQGDNNNPLKTISEAIARLPKYLDRHVFIYFVPTYLAETEINISGFSGDGTIHLQKWPLVYRYIKDWTNGSTSNDWNHWVEMQAIYSNGVNILNGAGSKGWLTSNADNGNDYTIITDGNTDSANYVSLYLPEPVFVKAYTGGEYTEVEFIKIWHYWNGGRSYYGTVTEISEDGSRWIKVFNSDRQGIYSETAEGHTIDVRRGYLKGNIFCRQNLVSIQIDDLVVDASEVGTYPFYMEKNNHVLLQRVVGFGNTNIPYGLYSYASIVRARDSEFNVFSNSCIISAYGGSVEVWNCTGGDAPTGIYAFSNGKITGAGTAPMGTTTGAKTNYGGQITTTFNHTAGESTIMTVTEKTKTWNNNTSDSWSEYENGWHSADDDVLQGKYDVWGPYRGLWFFGTSVRDTVMNTNIKRIRCYVTRSNSSGETTSTIVLRWHGYANKTSTIPTIASAEYKEVVINRGESKWVDITNFAPKFEDGSAFGIGIYTASYSDPDRYVRMTNNAKLEITYES